MNHDRPTRRRTRRGGRTFVTLLVALLLGLAGAVGLAQPALATPGTDDYPSNLKNAGQDALVDPWLFYNRECTSFVAWRLNNDNKVNFTNSYKGVHWGNANNWDNAARAAGIPVDNTPAVGAVAQTDAGGYGHVAWVKAVGSGTVTVEEYNYSNPGAYGTRTVSTGTFVYIHIKDLSNDDPFGSYDSVSSPEPGKIRVGGWAIDPNDRTASLAVHVYVGGPAGSPNAIGTAISANLSRPDVAAVYPGSGDKHGFDSVISAPGGSYPVCVYAINIGPGSNALIQCRNVTVADPNPFGSYDSVSSPEPGKIRVDGWAIDPNDRTASLAMHVYIGGPFGTAGVTGVQQISANLSRPDVAATYPGSGDKHGFGAVIPAPVGSYPVCVYAINIGPGSNVLFNCLNVTVTGCTSAPFKDVPKNSTFCGQIKWMKDRGISTGWPDGTYRPGASVTREAMAAFMARFAGASTPACTKAPFKDVPKTNQFCAQIKWMSDHGIATGWADDTFRPGATVTRQAMAAFMARFAGASTPACTKAPFKDVPKTNQFCAQIKWMSDKGITTGWADGTFRPDSNVTREAMSAFLYRLNKLIG